MATSGIGYEYIDVFAETVAVAQHQNRAAAESPEGIIAAVPADLTDNFNAWVNNVSQVRGIPGAPTITRPLCILSIV